MKKNERISAQRELIEEIGRFFDKEGLQPIAGRIMGLLMVMDKEQFTFDEITEELQISKSSASNTLRNLEIRGDIEYVTLPGDRKRYFRLKKTDTFRVMEEFADRMKYMVDFVARILELKADKNSPISLFMKDVIEMADFMLSHMDHMKEQYEKLKAKNSK